MGFHGVSANMLHVALPSLPRLTGRPTGTSTEPTIIVILPTTYYLLPSQTDQDGRKIHDPLDLPYLVPTGPIPTIVPRIRSMPSSPLLENSTLFPFSLFLLLPTLVARQVSRKLHATHSAGPGQGKTR